MPTKEQTQRLVNFILMCDEARREGFSRESYHIKALRFIPMGAEFEIESMGHDPHEIVDAVYGIGYKNQR